MQAGAELAGSNKARTIVSVFTEYTLHVKLSFENQHYDVDQQQWNRDSEHASRVVPILQEKGGVEEFKHSPRALTVCNLHSCCL